MARDRARRVRAFAKGLEDQFGVRFEAAYDSGPTWSLSWTDGPGFAAICEAGDAADLAAAKLRFYRLRSTKALALTAIRMAAAGRLGRGSGRSGPLWQVESEMNDIDFPERPGDDLQAALADRLIAIATETSQAAWAKYRSQPRQGFSFSEVPLGVDETAALLLRDKGLGWLVGETAQLGVELPPLVVLSVRYAPGADAVQAVAWRDRAQPLPLQVAVAAAIADAHLTEAAVAEAVRRAGVPLEQISTGTLQPAGGR